MEVAERLGRRLARDAFWHESRCTWLGWTSEAVGDRLQPVYRALGPNLYDGMGGITVFLTRLAAVTDDPIIRRTAQGGLDQVLALRQRAVGPGAYIGAGGVGFALVAGGAALGREDAIREGLELLIDPSPDPERPDVPDVLAGEAGRIQAILAAAPLGRTEELLAAAAVCGRKLLATARTMHRGFGWEVPDIGSDAPLGGYSHGVSGIACALAGLGAALGESSFVDAARGAVAYERSLFDEKEKNWPDLRPVAADDRDDEARFAVTWCNGAVGIGLARLYLRAAAPDGLYEAEIDAAWNATLRSVSETKRLNYSLCHGMCGNLEFLADAGRALDRPEWISNAERIADETAARVYEERDSWRSGVISRAETPTLMLGLAGIGHFYLRLAVPERVASVLVIHSRSIMG